MNKTFTAQLIEEQNAKKEGLQKQTAMIYKALTDAEKLRNSQIHIVKVINDSMSLLQELNQTVTDNLVELDSLVIGLNHVMDILDSETENGY